MRMLRTLLTIVIFIFAALSHCEAQLVIPSFEKSFETSAEHEHALPPSDAASPHRPNPEIISAEPISPSPPNTDITERMFGRKRDPTVPPKPSKSIGDRIRNLGNKLRRPSVDTVPRPFGVDSPSPPTKKRGLLQRGKEAWGRFRSRTKPANSPTTKKKGLLQRAKDKLGEYRDRYRAWRDRRKGRPPPANPAAYPRPPPSASPQYLPATIEYPDGRRHHYDESGRRHETMAPRPPTPQRSPSVESLSGFAPFRAPYRDDDDDNQPEMDENGDFPVRGPEELSPYEKDRRATGLHHPRPQRPQGDFRPVLGWTPATGRIGNTAPPKQPGFHPGLARRGSVHPMERR